MDTSVDELVSHLDDGDMSELRRRYRVGGLAFLQPKLGAPFYKELGARLDGGDRNSVYALLIDKGVVPAPSWWKDVQLQRRRSGVAWLALLPLIVVLAVIALALGRCGDDDDVRSSAGSTVEQLA
jgi:hypothetical protein